MERYTFLSVLIATLLLVAIAIFVLPGQQAEGPVHLPWQVERLNGTTRVFGITLGQTTVAQAEIAIGEPAEVSLFRSREGEIDVEAYFDQATISGLKAKLVAAVALSDEQKAAMYDRGVRVATLGSGTRKVTLSEEDLAEVRRTAIGTLTYIPQINLEPELIAQRFGEPARRVPDPRSETAVHWLYPELGLDIALSDEEKEVLQYVPPAEFGRLVAPLEAAPE